MKPKKILAVLAAGLAVGFVVGLVVVWSQLQQAAAHVKANQYFGHGMSRMAALSFQDAASSWLKIMGLVTAAFIILWLVGEYFISPVMGIHGSSRIKRRFLLYRRKSMFKAVKPVRDVILALAVLLIIFNLGMFLDNKISTSHKPSVILIVCETLRADHMGFQGYHRDNTVNMDSLAGQSFVFKNAYTQAPCTKPSMWNVVTSKYQSAIPAKDEYVTAAEYFRSKKYRTAAFISQQFLGEEKSNLHQGFDVYDVKYEKDEHGLAVRRATSITDAATAWMDHNRKFPFFAWLVYFDPHDPYLPPEEFRGYYNKTDKYSGDRRADHIHMKDNPLPEEHRQFLINAYDEEIRFLDHELGRLFSYLKSSGLYHDSVIILTADHGEELGENGDRWDHCQLLSQEEIWIPLLIKMPQQERRVEIEQAVQNIDIYPTLVDYFCAKHRPRFYDSLEGKSLMPLRNGGKPGDHRFAVSFWQEQKCIVKGRHKYWVKKGEESLRDIKTNQDFHDEAVLDSLRRELDRVYNKYILKKEYYKDTAERLKSLGYIKK